MENKIVPLCLVDGMLQIRSVSVACCTGGDANSRAPSPPYWKWNCGGC